MPTERAALLAMPAEIRLQIYGYLLDDGGHTCLPVRNLPAAQYEQAKGQIRRSCYWVQERTLRRSCYETSYCLGPAAPDSIATTATTDPTPDPPPGTGTGTAPTPPMRPFRFHTAIMAVNRLVNAETSHLLYTRHTFDFGRDTEAAVPFLRDRRPATLPLISSLALRKNGPALSACGGGDADAADWRAACRFMAAAAPGLAVRRLRIVVEGRRPNGAWEGPQRFSVADLELLAGIQHESLGWVTELARLRGVEELELVADLACCALPKSGPAVVFAALSASIETTLADYLRKLLRIET